MQGAITILQSKEGGRLSVFVTEEAVQEIMEEGTDDVFAIIAPRDEDSFKALQVVLALREADVEIVHLIEQVANSVYEKCKGEE